MEVITLGKFENKLSEAGVVGGSAKQELSGIHFFTSNLPRTHERTPAISPHFLVAKVPHTPLPTFASSSKPSNHFFPFPTTNRTLEQTGVAWSSTKTPQAPSSLVPKVLLAPILQVSPQNVFSPSPTTETNKI